MIKNNGTIVWRIHTNLYGDMVKHHIAIVKFFLLSGEIVKWQYSPFSISFFTGPYKN